VIEVAVGDDHVAEVGQRVPGRRELPRDLEAAAGTEQQRRAPRCQGRAGPQDRHLHARLSLLWQRIAAQGDCI